jgi:hypothetical protein
VVCDRGRAGEVWLDHVDKPRLVRCDAVAVEKPLEIREQKAVLACESDNAGVDGVQPSPKLKRGRRERPSSRRPTSLSPSLGS